MSHDLLQARALCALRPCDAVTGAMIRRGLRITGAGVRVVRNLSGLYVVVGAPGFAAYAAAFDAPPPAPAAGSLQLSLALRDPLGAYLARQFVLALPRDPAPAHASQPGSLFLPVDVALYPAPAARVELGWAALRASVRRADGAKPGLYGALLRIERAADNALLALGLTDARGEALVAAAGIPVVMTGGGGGAVMTSEVEVRVTAFVDPAAAQPAPGGPEPAPPDPDDLNARRAALRSAGVTVRLASGRATAVQLEVALP